MNERIMKNIAYCYAGSGDNQVEVMMKFATILMGRDMEKLKRFNDYLESALALEETEPSVVALLRQSIEDSLDVPEKIYYVIQSGEGMKDAASAGQNFMENMIKRGYYEERIFYVCPVCRKMHPVDSLSGSCLNCGEDLVREIGTIERIKSFQDFFAQERLVPQDKKPALRKKENHKPIEENGYSLPKTFTEKEKVLSDEDIVNNPFFHKRHKSS